MVPERAIPAAAHYLAGMERKFGGRDWAIFAYHCGQGCVGMMQEITRRARGIPADKMTVARMFFAASPAWNRELYDAIQQQMQRDYSPTYWFRIRRAEQLLALYRSDPEEFERLAQEYKSDFVAHVRAPHRLSVWLKKDDLVFRTEDDIRGAMGQKLVKALDRPDYFGYTVKLPADSDYRAEASPSAIGTLAYIAFETRRLYEEMGAKGPFQPLVVTSLVEPEELRPSEGQAGSAVSRFRVRLRSRLFRAAPGGTRVPALRAQRPRLGRLSRLRGGRHGQPAHRLLAGRARILHEGVPGGGGQGVRRYRDRRGRQVGSHIGMELIFESATLRKAGHCAHALGHGIFAEGETW